MIKSITVDPSRAESRKYRKVESVDQVGCQLPSLIDLLAQLDRFRRGSSRPMHVWCTCVYNFCGHFWRIQRESSIVLNCGFCS